jgi:type I restriction enzyme R subunit
LGWTIRFGPDLDVAERQNLGEVVLGERLRTAVGKINPGIPAEAREEAVKKVLNVCHLSPVLIEANHLFHRMLVDGVDVEYRRAGGHRNADLFYV